MNLMFEARQWLANFCQDTLSAIEPGFVSAIRLRRVTWDSRTRRQRLAIMGDPTKYIEVLYAGEDASLSQETATGQHVITAYIFRVNVWYAYKDSEDYTLSSQAVWDNLLEGEAGLLTLLRQTDSFSIAPEHFQIFNPEGAQTSEVTLDNEGNELAHFLSFTIIIRS